MYLLLHLAGRVPLELDEEHRPRWLYAETTTPQPPRAAYLTLSAAAAADHRSSVACPVPSRGWMGGIGGCAHVGGACIGCTAPGFADRFLTVAHPRPPV
jgi:hydrogenase small subunit